MVARKSWLLILLAAGLLLLAVRCADSNIDDGDSANVLLELTQLTLPPVTATLDTGVPPVCNKFLVTEATATLTSLPKSELAITSPFNDALIESLTISYVWDDPISLTTLPYTTSERIEVPADGTNTINFFPIKFADLTTAMAGHTAELSLLFLGRTEDGTAVQAVGGGTLAVNSCP